MIVGDKAPDFTVRAYVKGEEKSITLSDYRGKWVVLFFYAGDFTFTWPTELACVAVRYPKFQELNAEVMAINVASVYSHKVWDEIELSKMVDGGIPYPMLADTSAAIGKSYDVYDNKTGATLRGTFIIDPEGTIQASEVMYGAVGRNPDEILRLLRAYQRYQSTKQAIPCGWHKGDKTISPALTVAGGVWQEWRP